jgi:hypothetical protein
MPEIDSEASADTARFQAFATQRDQELPPPWKMRAEGAKIGILVAVVIVAAIFAAIIGVTLGA